MVQTPTLWDIGDEMRAVEQLLEDNGGDISDPEFEAAIDDWIKTNKDNLVKKLDSYGYLINQRKGFSEMRANEAARQKALATTDINFIAKLKERLKYFFEEWEISKIESDHFKWRIQKNGGSAPLELTDDFRSALETAEQTDDWSQIPERYIQTTTVFNSSRLVEDLKEAESLLLKHDQYFKDHDSNIELLSVDELTPGEILTIFTAEDQVRLSELADISEKYGNFAPRGTHLRIQ